MLQLVQHEKRQMLCLTNTSPDFRFARKVCIVACEVGFKNDPCVEFCDITE
jgi:hypothetical protein